MSEPTVAAPVEEVKAVEPVAEPAATTEPAPEVSAAPEQAPATTVHLLCSSF